MLSTIQTGMRVPADIFERYERLSKNTGRSRSWYMNQALNRSIDQLEYEYGILSQVEDWRAGRLQTHSSDEVRAHCGL